MKAKLISCFGYYDIRLRFIEKALKENGYEVIMLFSDYDHINKKYWKWKKNNIDLIHVPSYKKNISIRRLWSHIRFANRVGDIIAEDRPDLVYVLLPPNLLCKKIIKQKKKKNFKVIFDVIDLWPESFPYLHKELRFFLPVLLWKRARDNYLQHADFVILECSYYFEQLSSYIKKEDSEVIYICKEKQFFSNNSNMETSISTLKFCYLGSINSIIDIDLIVKFLKDIKVKREVFLNIIGDGEKKKQLLFRLFQYNIAYKDYGKIFDDKKVYKILGNCHYGLNMYKSTTNIGLTMKSLDYINAGVPIINSNIYDTGNLIQKYGAGFHISSNSYNDTIEQIQKMDTAGWVKQKKGVYELWANELSEEICLKKIRQVIKERI